MIKKIVIYLCLTYLPLQAQLMEEETGPIMPSVDFVNTSDQEHFQLLIRGLNQFAFNIYGKLSENRGNFCVSPFAIAANLTMVSNGAKQLTSTEIQSVLHYPSALNLLVGDLNLLLLSKPTKPKNAAYLLSANAIWIQKNIPLLVSFQQILKRDFQINPGIVDFQQESFKAVRTINEWVSTQTKNKMGQLINNQDIHRQTNLVLTSGIYLQGQWKTPFNLSLTKRENFYITANNRSILVPLMALSGEFSYYFEPGFECVTLPYVFGDKGPQIMATFVIPQTFADLKNLEKSLSEDNWLKWQKQAEMRTLHFFLPRFRVDDRLDLTRILPSMGIKSAFTSTANFSGITTEKQLFIDYASHRAIYRIDEKGSDLSSPVSTPMTSQPQPNDQPTQEVKANHPFVFIVWDQKSRAILLIGRISLP